MKDVKRAYMKKAHTKRNRCDEPFRVLLLCGHFTHACFGLTSFCSLSVLDDINVWSVSQCKFLQFSQEFILSESRESLCCLTCKPCPFFYCMEKCFESQHLILSVTYKKNSTNTWSGQILFFLLRRLILFLILALRTNNFTSAQPSQLDSSYDFYCALLSQLSCVVARPPVCAVLCAAALFWPAAVAHSH